VRISGLDEIVDLIYAGSRAFPEPRRGGSATASFQCTPGRVAFILSKVPLNAGTPRLPPPSPEYLKFLAAYEPRITRLALLVRALVLEQAPQAIELLYDAYNAVAAGYSFTGRPSDTFIHSAAYAQWVNPGFHRGSELADPQGLLQEAGDGCVISGSRRRRCGHSSGPRSNGPSARNG